MGQPQNRYQVDDGKQMYRVFRTKRVALCFALTYARLHKVETWVCDTMAHKGVFHVWRYSASADRMTPQKTNRY